MTKLMKRTEPWTKSIVQSHQFLSAKVNGDWISVSWSDLSPHMHTHTRNRESESVRVFLDKIDVTMSVLQSYNAKKHISRPACTDHLPVLPFTSPTLLYYDVYSQSIAIIIQYKTHTEYKYDFEIHMTCFSEKHPISHVSLLEFQRISTMPYFAQICQDMKTKVNDCNMTTNISKLCIQTINKLKYINSMYSFLATVLFFYNFFASPNDFILEVKESNNKPINQNYILY